MDLQNRFMKFVKRNANKLPNRRKTETFFALICLWILVQSLSSTPDSDFVPVAGYKNNAESMRLRKLAGDFRRVEVRFFLKGFDRSESVRIKKATLNTLREDSYFIWNEGAEEKGIQSEIVQKGKNSKTFSKENLLMTIVLRRSKSDDGQKKILFRMDWLNRKTLVRANFHSEERFVDEDQRNIQKLLYTWKSEILPIQDVFFIENIDCVSNDAKTTAFLEIGCKNLLQKTGDSGSFKKYWEKAERSPLTGRDRESIQNNLAYYSVSLGDFKKAEECFSTADSLDDSESYRRHRDQLEAIREFRKKYRHYETKDSP
ncbi:tetratricopeptide repeat protein [Leptospira stimsonii]|nr:hypothetical protein [Leptospira stimsonii]